MEMSDRRNAFRHKLLDFLRENQEEFMPTMEELLNRDNDPPTGDLLLNNAVIVVSFIDEDQDEWLSVMRLPNMPDSTAYGLLARAAESHR